MDNLLTESTCLYTIGDLMVAYEAIVYHFCTYKEGRATLIQSVGWQGASSVRCVYRHLLRHYGASSPPL